MTEPITPEQEERKRYFISYYDPINGYNDFFAIEQLLDFDDPELALAECESLNEGLGDMAKAIQAKFVIIDSETGEEFKE